MINCVPLQADSEARAKLGLAEMTWISGSSPKIIVSLQQVQLFFLYQEPSSV